MRSKLRSLIRQQLKNKREQYLELLAYKNWNPLDVLLKLEENGYL